MAPLLLEGETLGEKRRYYNKLVNEAVLNNSFKNIPKLNYEEQDIDNIFKIDIASHNKDVNYILEVLKCEDMLFVSRALKQATWLIQDNEYAHIINPVYLNDNLFPQMTVKAINKLMLQIRLHLKEVTRVEEFCNYLMLQDLQLGLKWLPRCSIPFIEKCVEKYAEDIPRPLLIRLCRQSFTFMEIFIRNCKSYQKFDIIESTTFLLRNNAEKYLDILDTSCHLRAKATQIIMKKCPNKILNDLDKYLYTIDTSTLSKFIKQAELKDFVLKIMKINLNFSFHIIQHFLKRFPKEDFPFIKQVFIDKIYNETEVVGKTPMALSGFASSAHKRPVNTSIYRWYKFAPFNTAFKDLKKLIRIESNPNERNAILAVMLHSAGHNLQHLQSIVQYYHDNHINESSIFIYHFLCKLLNRHFFIYDTKSWEYLNAIFTSMEVYEESTSYHSCINAIILYKVIHDENVPNIIEDKFIFDTFKSYQKSLLKDDKEKVFDYLYKLEMNKLECEIGKTEANSDKIACPLNNILRLLIDWNKELSEYPQIITHIKNLINKNQQMLNDLSPLYDMKKSWKKIFFTESILLKPTPEMCINVLKHGPQLLSTYKNEVRIICNIDTMAQKVFLNKVRIFWAQSLADFFKSIYLEKLENKIDHSSAVFGLTILLPQKQYLELVHQYVPTETKIDWRQQQETSFSVSRNIAKKMHLARPQVPLSTVLLYAKGSSLQYTMPSLNAVLYNLSCCQAQNQLKVLLDAPVSLQKHGIRIASKLKQEDLQQILSGMWNSTKNSSIRAALMKETFSLLCKQKNPEVIEQIWDIFNTFVDNLTFEENKTTYCILSRINKVPHTIKVKFGLKSYKFLKSLPAKLNCSSVIRELKEGVGNIIDIFDVDAVAEIFLNHLLEYFSLEQCLHIPCIANYLLSAETEEAQNDRFNKILLPILIHAFNNWDKKTDEEYFARCNLKWLLDVLYCNFEKSVLDKELNIPVVLFNSIFTKLDTSLSKIENYTLITTVKLAQSYVQILDKILKIKKYDAFKMSKSDKKCKWMPLYLEAAPEFAKNCLDYFKIDVKENFQSIYLLFANALSKIFSISQQNVVTFATLEEFLKCEDSVEGHLLALKLLSECCVYEEDEKSLKSKLLNKISTNPSKEVQMHYWRYQDPLN